MEIESPLIFRSRPSAQASGSCLEVETGVVMETCHFRLCSACFAPSHRPSSLNTNPLLFFPNSRPKSPGLLPFRTRLSAVKSPRGFGPPPRKKKRKGTDGERKPDSRKEGDDDDDEYDMAEDTIPEVVTNRMMRRMGFSVGVPLLIGLLFFPFFYYLKVVLKLDVPTWVPVIVSFFFFGSALLGVSYGIVSSSWDPLREGSLLGWNEAQKNWPVFWQSLWGKPGNK